MGVFLPSEVARLVLGYLKDEECTVAYNEFLNSSKHLEECRGRPIFFTKVMGLTLHDILDDYGAIYNYVSHIKWEEDLEKKMSRCLCLLDKITLIVENICNLEKEPFNKKKSSYDSNTLLNKQNKHKRTCSNHDSSDSADSIYVERPHKYHSHKTTENNNKKRRTGDVGVTTQSSITETTNLADLPGHKSDNIIETENKACKDIPENVNTILLPNKNDLLVKKSFNQFNAPSVKKYILSKDKELSSQQNQSVTNNDSCSMSDVSKKVQIEDEFVQKTPPKRGVKLKSFLSSLKKFGLNENFGNDSLDVTTLTNAMLDWPELHERIADNINQMINSSSSTPELENSNKNENNISASAKDKLNEALTADDDSQQMNGIIKAVVEKTEKDPLFDQLLNEVLVSVTSLESATGSDSDVVSRPGTSTPEASNGCSPASHHSFEPQVNCKLSSVKKNKRSIKLFDNSECSDTPDELVASLHKRVNRDVIGGKRMDVLREKLQVEESHDFCQENKINLKNKSEEQKIIILTNETVRSANAEDISNVERNKNDKSKSTDESINSKNELPSNESESTIGTQQFFLPTRACKLKRNVITGKPPEIIISNNKNMYSENSNIFTEKEIIDMPTVIMFKPMENEIESDNINSSEQNMLLNYNDLNEAHNSSVSKLVPSNIMLQKTGEDTLSARSEFIPVIPIITGSSDTTGNFISLYEKCEKINVEWKLVDNTDNSLASFTNSNLIGLNENMEIINIPCQEEIVISTDGTVVYPQDQNFIDISNKPFVESDNIITKAEKEINENNKISTPEKGLTKKKSSSTPSRKYSHIRVLDFNTPVRSVHERTARTSPKGGIRTRTHEVNSKSVKSLFTPIIENNSLNTPELLKNNGEGRNSITNPENSVGEECHQKKNLLETNREYKDDEIKTTDKKKLWDHDLRKLIESKEESLPEIKKNKKKYNKEVSSKSHSDKKSSKQFVNKKEKVDKKLKKVSKSKKTPKKSKKKEKNVSQQNIKEYEDKTSILEKDLELSTITESDSGTPNTSNTEVKFSKVNIIKNECKEDTKYLKKVSQKESIKKKMEWSRNNAILMNKNKKVKTSTFKVKLGSKAYSERKEENRKNISDESVIMKIESKNLKSIENCEKSLNMGKVDQEITESEIHTTPDFPQEFLHQPINLKRNLSSLLITPFKSACLDFPITTPKFLSPDENYEPISSIKILGLPTPNFDLTPDFHSKLLKNSPTNSPIYKDYSSGGSYYKPDEVEMPKSLTNEKENICGVTEDKITKKDDISNENTSDRVLRPRSRFSGPKFPAKFEKDYLSSKNKKKSNKKTVKKSGLLKEDTSTSISSDSLFNDSANGSEKLSSKSKFVDVVHQQNQHSNNDNGPDELEKKRQRTISIIKSELNPSKNTTKIPKKFSQLNKFSKQKLTSFKKFKSCKTDSIAQSKYVKNPVKNNKFKIEFQEDVSETVSASVVSNKVIDLLPASKSRRKSSTPRKLEKIESDGEIERLIVIVQEDDLKASHLKNEISENKSKPPHSEDFAQGLLENRDEISLSVRSKSQEILTNQSNMIVTTIQDEKVNLSISEIHNPDIASLVCDEYIDTDEDEVWCHCECNSDSFNFISVKSDMREEIKNRTMPDNFLNNFTLNASICHNAESNKTEIRTMKVSDFALLLDIDPNLNLTKSTIKSASENITQAAEVITVIEKGTNIIDNQEDDDMMNFALSSSESQKCVDEEKKKALSVNPQTLLQEIDIEEILSKLHGS